MSDPRTDRIAREAARMVGTGEERDIGRAIRSAVENLGLRDARPPGIHEVRNHVRLMAMQALGAEGYRASVHRVWSAAEQLMTALEEGALDAATLLAGRAARGEIDGGVILHLRVYTARSIGEIAGVLVDLGYEEPRFETAETRFGRLDRLRLEEDDLEIVVTRCLPDPATSGGERGLDLFTGKPVTTATVEDLRRKLDEDSGATD